MSESGRFQATKLSITLPQTDLQKDEALKKTKAYFDADLEYAVAAHEYHEDGGSHLHIYVKLLKQFRTSDRQKALVKIYGVKGNLQACKFEASWIKYITEDEDYVSCNIDVAKYLENVDKKIARAETKGVGHKVTQAIKEGKTIEELMDIFPAYMLSNGKKVNEFIRMKKQFANKPEVEDHKLYEWQQELIDYIKGPVDPRKIRWYVDYKGNAGKSYMADMLEQHHGAFVTTGGKTADIAYAYDYQRIVVFDMSKSRQDAMNYEILENFKNGRIFSTKYESVVKRTGRNHVIVLSNFEPNYEALIKDRWDVKKLSEQESDEDEKYVN